MSIITAKVTNKYFYKNSLFDILVDSNIGFTNLEMSFFTDDMTTSNIPQTFQVLKTRLPSILRSKCFNDHNLPFRKEVKNTEFGHLFEHILLEYICELKRENGILSPVHNGVTKWDWNKEKKGIFHITVDVGSGDSEFLSLSLHKTIKLMEIILLSDPVNNSKDPSQGIYEAASLQLHIK